jgi:SNF2 family DNA or RNA helicase
MSTSLPSPSKIIPSVISLNEHLYIYLSPIDEMGLGKTLQALTAVALIYIEKQTVTGGMNKNRRESPSKSGTEEDIPNNTGDIHADTAGHSIASSASRGNVNRSSDAPATSPSPPLLPSMVVCPASLVQQWAREIVKFFPDDLLAPLVYCGSKSLLALQDSSRGSGRGSDVSGVCGCVVIASYDAVRRDCPAFAGISWEAMVSEAS